MQGKVRDLLDVAVISLYFGLFLLWSSTQADALPRLLTVVLLVAAAFVMAWNRATLEEAAEIASAG